MSRQLPSQKALQNQPQNQQKPTQSLKNLQKQPKNLPNPLPNPNRSPNHRKPTPSSNPSAVLWMMIVAMKRQMNRQKAIRQTPSSSSSSDDDPFRSQTHPTSFIAAAARGDVTPSKGSKNKAVAGNLPTNTKSTQTQTHHHNYLRSNDQLSPDDSFDHNTDAFHRAYFAAAVETGPGPWGQSWA
jgi:hypothetical protein